MVSDDPMSCCTFSFFGKTAAIYLRERQDQVDQRNISVRRCLGVKAGNSPSFPKAVSLRHAR
jgi:hypothetical protein